MDQRYRTLGYGPEKVLILHDFFASTEAFDPLHPYLSCAHCTYVFFDLRGFGRSREICGEYTLEEIASDCLALADHLHWDRFHVVGYTMSSMGMQYLNWSAKNRIISATAITPIAATGVKMPKDFLEIVKRGINGDDSIMSTLIRGSSGERYNDAFVHFKTRQFRENATAESRLGYLKMINTNDISKKVKGISTPYHVILGRSDRPWHCREVMEKTFKVYYPNCSITVIEDASHFPMQETPILLANLIDQFVLKNRSNKSRPKKTPKRARAKA